MSYRHQLLETIYLSGASVAEIQDAIDMLIFEHQQAQPSIEERCARAEALAIFAIVLLRRTTD